ncbi:Acyl-protein thioesterase 1 [Rhynchospora pubera]|uniref:Acyl-protein thioesterase 1 n=1 Tax=Rhynchospora pubera TaxID=906938 RepID=A0AAV8EGL9_9POAL|nr:Acyl-protein thioesterase 1 [Rhynchospora pubera]
MAGPARSFVLWLHGLGDSGPANEPIRSFFSDSVFNLTKWAFPSAPNQPVSCNYGSIMPSWFDIHEIPISSASPKNEKEVIEAVQKVHAMIDKEVENGISPENVFVCGFSQGGALTLASVLLYPKTLGGGAVFSGWVPFNSSIIEKISPEAKKIYDGVLVCTQQNKEKICLDKFHILYGLWNMHDVSHFSEVNMKILCDFLYICLNNCWLNIFSRFADLQNNTETFKLTSLFSVL